MGYRLHYATTYQVKYGGGFFNHKTKINQLLADKCDASYNNDMPEYSDYLEVEREELMKLVQDIKNNPKEYENYLSANDWDYTSEDLVKIFEEMIQRSDQSNTFIILQWL